MPDLFEELNNIKENNFVDGETNLNSLYEKCSLYMISVDYKIFFLKNIIRMNVPELAAYAFLFNDIIYSFCVKKELQGNGYGKKLLILVLKKNKPLTLHVRESNIVAKKLYESVGFKFVSLIKDFYTWTSVNENGIEMIYK